ncbi:MopE-related protein [Kaarinaea lacus]
MQVFVKTAVLFYVLSVCGLVSAAGATGTISGLVNYCDQGGILGMKISLSGRQASIYTANDGKFLFESLPAGTYALFYTVDEKLLHISNGVIVKAGESTQLGEVAFCVANEPGAVHQEMKPIVGVECPSDSKIPDCVDNDKDGVVATKDCDDNDEQIRPGAPESCDGKDNNCNGKIDDLGTVWIENGEGICQNGSIAVKSCNKGFADCDAKPANGCETDIMNDNDNCGACGNVCPSLEICVAGIC